MASHHQLLTSRGFAASLLASLVLGRADGSIMREACMLQTGRTVRTNVTVTAGCADKETQNCAYWESQGWCTSGQYAAYTSANCEKSCGLCGGSSTSASSPTPAPTAAQASTSSCVDKNSNDCEYWASQGWCESSSQYASHVTSNCEKSCGLCGGSSSGGAGGNPTPAPASPTPSPTPTKSNGGSIGGSAALEDAIELANLINEYRAENNKAAVPLSPAMMAAASIHVQDLNINPLSAPCNAHSWSTLSSDIPGCCYTGSEGECMWTKPEQVTSCWKQAYPGNGYENAYGPGVVTPQGCLDGWKKSSAHNDVLLNQGPWSGQSTPSSWPAMGVAIEGTYCVLWMGDATDPAGTFNPATAASEYDCCVPSQYCPSF